MCPTGHHCGDSYLWAQNVLLHIHWINLSNEESIYIVTAKQFITFEAPKRPNCINQRAMKPVNVLNRIMF